jgi:hypothetical protein
MRCIGLDCYQRDGSNAVEGVGSCRSGSFCSAVDGRGGNVLTSTNPTGGAAAWNVTYVDGSNPLEGVLSQHRFMRRRK